jgi:Fur family ferric uptake transcriptional regulator
MPARKKQQGRAKGRAKARVSAEAGAGEEKPVDRQTLERFLKTKGLRWTKQREVILDLFLEGQGHLTSDEIHRRVAEVDPSIGLSTVYRTLRLFVEAGVASERHFHDGVARFEVVQPHHDPLICLGCNSIVEFEDDEVERLQEDIARARGFSLVSHRHELYGYCRGCGK